MSNKWWLIKKIGTLIRYLHTRGNTTLPSKDCSQSVKLINHQLPVIDSKRVIDWVAHRQVLLVAYEEVRKNPGRLTPGRTPDTLDGFGLGQVEELRRLLLRGKVVWIPARRMFILKSDGVRKRPLDVTGQKVLQKAVEIALQVLFERSISNTSHGFVMGRGVASCINAIKSQFVGADWIIEGDIKNFFGSVNHDILMGILKDKIQCELFLSLVLRHIQAGYLDSSGKQIKSSSGIPQGSIISPVLANIYLSLLDQRIEKVMEMKPVMWKRNPKFWYRHDKAIQVMETKGVAAANNFIGGVWLPSKINSHRISIVYVRYADDFVIGVFGNRDLALGLKAVVSNLLQDSLGLTLSEDKTKVTRAEDGFKFLGFVAHVKSKKVLIDRKGFKRSGNYQVKVVTHTRGIIKKLITEGFGKLQRIRCWHVIATRKTGWVNFSHDIIMKKFLRKWAGIKASQRVSDDKRNLKSVYRLLWMSLALTLASKYNVSLPKLVEKFGKGLGLEGGKQFPTEFDILGPDRFLRESSVLEVRNSVSYMEYYQKQCRTKLPLRKVLKPCEMCSSKREVEMHFFRANSVAKNRQDSTRLLFDIQLCKKHHDAVHSKRLRKNESLWLENWASNKAGMKLCDFKHNLKSGKSKKA